MIVSDVNRYVFVHIPRTGGTTLSGQLIEHVQGSVFGLKHWQMHDLYLNPDVAARVAGYDVFTIVRNTFDWLVSAYYGGTFLSKGLSFDAFLDWLEARDLMRSQCGYLEDASGALVVTDVFRFETRELAEVEIARRYGAKLVDLRRPPVHARGPYVARARPDNYRTVYTPALRARVEATYARDIAEFGFKF